MPDSLKYSVIIPAYNAEDTIERCLQSLLVQKRNDVEIIVINDGSTDKTANIIDNIAATNKTVICLHQVNSGVSNARNNGLSHATGTYITFVDSDDWVAEEYFSELDKADPDTDLCYFQFAGCSEDDIALFKQIDLCEAWIDKMNLLLSSRIIMKPSNKRFKREIINSNKLQFIEGLHISEDFNFGMLYSVHCKTIKMYNSPIYCLDETNDNSLSRKARKNLTEDIIKGFSFIENTIKSSPCTTFEKHQLLITSDYLYVKNVCTCIAETFKYCKPQYLKNRKMYKNICKRFIKPLGEGEKYYNKVHKILRSMLRLDLIYPFYIISWLVKGLKFKKYRGN